MRLATKIAVQTGALAVAAAAVIAPASAALAGTAGPTLSATPNTGLKDGDTVTVSGTNYPNTSHPFAIVECSSLQPDGSGCSSTPSATGATDASGNIPNTPVVVHTGTEGNGKCKPGSTCFLVASSDPANPADLAAVGTTTIKFAPFPSITAKPSKGIKNGDKVSVSGKHFPANKPLAVVVCASKTDTSKCDQTDGDLLQHSTNGSGSFKGIKIPVFTKGTQSGVCKPGKKCFVAATTDISGQGADKSQDAVTKIQVVKSTIATKTVAKEKSDKVVGKVTAGKKGVAGLKTVLDVRKGGHWKKVATLKTKKGGKFHSAKLSKSGKYEVKTPKQKKGSKSYGASHSKVIKVKV